MNEEKEPALKPTGPGMDLTSRRDQFAWWMCNWILNHIASEWYGDRIGFLIRYGADAYKRDGWTF